MRLLLATTSAHKLGEIRHILRGVEVLGLADLGDVPPEPDEPFETFTANAAHKAEHYGRLSGLPTVADDSGLCADALDGGPGVRSKRFAGRTDLRGVALDHANNTHLLDRLAGVPEAARGAHYTCAAAFYDPNGGRRAVTIGTCAGIILDAPRGSGGFGYDPLFFLPSLGRTFGEVDPEVKERLSHRGRALRALRGALSLHD